MWTQLCPPATSLCGGQHWFFGKARVGKLEKLWSHSRHPTEFGGGNFVSWHGGWGHHVGRQNTHWKMSTQDSSCITGQLPTLLILRAMLVHRMKQALPQTSQPIEAPVEKHSWEPLPEDRVVPFPSDEETVLAAGMTIFSSCTLKVLRAGCGALDFSSRGGKPKCLQTMVKHVKANVFMVAGWMGVLSWPVTCAPPKKKTPTLERFMGKRIVFNFRLVWFIGPGLSQIWWIWQTNFFVHARPCNQVDACCAPQKGAKFLQHMVTEVTRCIVYNVYTQHRELATRTDYEPAIIAAVDGMRKTCRVLGITLHDESAPVGEHESNNGAGESKSASFLVQQTEDQVATGRISFRCTNPVYCLALLRASWIINHLIVSEGLTPFERGIDRSYSGKPAVYGEEVLGYLKTGLKAGPRWQRGVWLGRTMSGDQHIVSTSAGMFITRSIKRSPKPFNLDRLGNVKSWPWEFGHAVLGNKLVYNKRVSQPLAFGWVTRASNHWPGGCWAISWGEGLIAAATRMLQRMFQQIGMDRNVQMMRHKPTQQRKPGLLTMVSQCRKLLVWPTTPRLEKAFQRHQSLTRALTRDITVRSPTETWVCMSMRMKQFHVLGEMMNWMNSTLWDEFQKQ